MRLTHPMRRILILGGTAWLGREIAAQFLSRGDEVTCLARGSSGSVAPGSLLIRADRTQPGAYDSITSTRWDEVVELSYDADLVSSSPIRRPIGR